ncbi:MAG: GTP-binding protein [Clostridiales bacterium]|jgi:G3E family GTPase|nr:GTP-binding protein [Clostridiales bacterium]
MAAETIVVSGFLGAGKTTLIQKLLGGVFVGEKVVLIENDFGEESVDAALLRPRGGNLTVRELNSGCICCGLSGDFVKTVGEVSRRFRPDKIIVEPSGVGKLSDIIKAFADPRVTSEATLAAAVTVADARRCRTHLDNFGEFFEDQIKNADAVLLSRAGEFPGAVDGARELIAEVNPRAVVYSEAWDALDAKELLRRASRLRSGAAHESASDCDCDCHDCNHGGCGHAAGEVFDTVTVRTDKIFTVGDLQACANQLERGAFGDVLRAKGIVRGEDGYVSLQYLPGETRVTDCAAAGGMLCVIGKGLDGRALVRLFGGEGCL